MAYSRQKLYQAINTPGVEARMRLMAQRTGVPLALHEAQIWKESSGRVGIAGDNGRSIGLGQIYDPTWKMLQGMDPSLTDRRDPIQNIRAQEMLWLKNLKATGGNQRKALRMYNGSGPMAERYADSLSPYLTGSGRSTAESLNNIGPDIPVGGPGGQPQAPDPAPNPYQQALLAERQRLNSPVDSIGEVGQVLQSFAQGLGSVKPMSGYVSLNQYGTA